MISVKNNPAQFPTADTAMTLTGPVGSLEALITVPREQTKSIIVVICHPHSLFGGTMHNKVVYTMARACNQMGLRTVRFNFRGVGKSAGEYAQGVGETDDLLAVLQWIKTVCPQDVIWLAGFSFGSFVAARAASVWSDTQLLLSVAPPVVNFDFTAFPVYKGPWIVVQGEEDEVVDPAKVFAWFESLPPPVQLIRVPTAGHFFHGQLVELREILITTLTPYIPS